MSKECNIIFCESPTISGTNRKSIGVEGAKTPTGIARAEAPGLSVAREKADAVPVESVAHVSEIDGFLKQII